MYNSIETFVDKVKQISRKLSLNPIVEYSYKLSQSIIHENRCVVLLQTNKEFIVKKDIHQVIHELRFSTKFINFVDKIIKHSNCEVLIVGLDLHRQLQKIYVVINEPGVNINNMLSMEVNNLSIINYKYYKSIVIDQNFSKLLDSIFPNEISNSLLQILLPYCQWGYIRCNLMNKLQL